jgi:hypothetical protein
MRQVDSWETVWVETMEMEISKDISIAAFLVAVKEK